MRRSSVGKTVSILVGSYGMFVEGCRGVRWGVANFAREVSARLYRSLSSTSRHRFAVISGVSVSLHREIVVFVASS